MYKMLNNKKMELSFLSFTYKEIWVSRLFQIPSASYKDTSRPSFKPYNRYKEGEVN